MFTAVICLICCSEKKVDRKMMLEKLNCDEMCAVCTEHR